MSPTGDHARPPETGNVTDDRFAGFETDFDSSDPSMPGRLYDLFGQLHERCPVGHVDRHGGFWMVTKHADVSRAARDHESFTTTTGVMIPPVGFTTRALPVEADPPEHTSLRRMLQPFFTLRSIREFEQPLRDLVNSHIDEFARDGHADLVTRLAEPVPPIALAMLLDLPATEWPTLRRITSEMLRTRYEDPDAAKAAVAEFEAYTTALIKERKETPGNDVVSAIVHGRVDGEPLTDADVHGMVHMLIGAGHETTVNGIGNLLYHLASMDGLREQLVADPSLFPAAVEESLRYDAPVQFLARTARSDLELRGAPIRAGDRLALMWGAASRDPEVFERADEFVCPREDNHHLAFGIGTHRCIGEHLARIEMQVAGEEVLRRLPDLHLAGDPVWKFKSNNRGLLSLPVAFTPAR
jgi:cytochrome P450